MTTFTTEDKNNCFDAYKLAKNLENFGYLENGTHFCPFQAQADMLRMQADEIKALRKQLIAACNELMEIKR